MEQKVIVRSETEAVFIVRPKGSCEVSGRNHYLYYIDEEVFKKVSSFVELFKSRLEQLMTVDKCNNVAYWEDNFHDKIRDFLTEMMPETDRQQISNSLSALGY